MYQWLLMEKLMNCPGLILHSRVVAQATVTMVMSGHKCILITNVQEYMSKNVFANGIIIYKQNQLYWTFTWFTFVPQKKLIFPFNVTAQVPCYILFLARISVKQGYPIQVCIRQSLLFLLPLEKWLPAELDWKVSANTIREQKRF